MPTDKLEIEISKFVKGEGYSFSSEDDDKKRVYIIYSSELKERLRAMISPFGMFARGSVQYKGENSKGDRILYHQNTDSDQLTLISREATTPKEQEMDENEKILAESEKLISELEQRKTEWKKREKELGILPNYTEKHFWCGSDKGGKTVYEGMYVKSETQSQLMTVEYKDKTDNSLRIQEITDKEVDQAIQKETFSQHQLPPKK